MRPPAGFLRLGLLLEALLSLPFCTGRPHAHGHLHDGRVRHAVENDTASSGSSLISPSAAVAWGEIPA